MYQLNRIYAYIVSPQSRKIRHGERGRMFVLGPGERGEEAIVRGGGFIIIPEITFSFLL